MSDPLDDAENIEPGHTSPPTLMDHLSFEAQVLQRLRDIDKRLQAIEAIVEGRTKVMLKSIELMRGCLAGLGQGAGTLLDRITNPSRNFLVFWIITVVGLGGLTMTEVFDLSAMAQRAWSGDEEPAAPAPEPVAIEPVDEEAPD